MNRARIRIAKRVGALLAVALGVLALSTSTAAAGSSSAQTQHLLLLQTDVNAPAPIAIAAGPIHARGTDKVIDATHDVFVFPAGSIKVRHTPTWHKDAFDRKTCLGTSRETGTYTVSGRSGAYKNAQGHGTYTVLVSFVGCNQNAAPEVFELRITASGPLSL